MADLVRIEKLLFCAKEMQLALYLAQHAPTDFVGRAVARHVVVRVRDFVDLAFAALGELHRQGVNVTPIRTRVTAYRDGFEEYYADTRTNLTAHVLEVEFSDRLELWTDLEVVKLSYFVDGAREVYDALVGLAFAGVVAFAPFPEGSDPELLMTLEGGSRRNDPGSYVRIGSDVLAASRANTVVALNLTPVHQRAGELAAIDAWLQGEWAMLQVCAGHVNAGRILKARILTDVVSYADCLTTRTDGDPVHRFSGLDDLLRVDGDPSAIDQLRAFYRLAVVLDPLRQVRNHVGAHLHSDSTMDVNAILRELDTFRLVDAIQLFEKLRAVFHMTCRRTRFLSSYLVNGAPLAGVAPSRSGHAGDNVKPFDEANPEATEIPLRGPPTYSQAELDHQLREWRSGGPGAFAAREYFRDAFTNSPVVEVVPHPGTPSGPPVEYRAAHAVVLDGLRSAQSEADVRGLLRLVGSCARGDPLPLVIVLLRHLEGCGTGGRDVSKRHALRALGQMPIQDGAWARAPLLSAIADDDPLVGAEAAAALYARLVEDRSVVASVPQGTTMFSQAMASLLLPLQPARRLLALTALASAFTAGQLSLRDPARTAEYAEISSALQTAGEQSLGQTVVTDRAWLIMRNGGDYVGLAHLVSETLAPNWDGADAVARAFVLAAMDGLVRESAALTTQSRCNRALAHLRAGDKARAAALALDVMRVDPLAFDAHLAMIPLLISAGVPSTQASGIVEDIAVTYVIDARTQPLLDAARAACAPGAVPQELPAQ